MNKVLKFYNYDKALSAYEDRLLQIHQARVKRSGLKIIAKPVLLLTILQGLENGRIAINRFEYDQVKPDYEKLFRKYFVRARQETLTPMYYPWYFMHHDGFWHLSWQGPEPVETESVSESPSLLPPRAHAIYHRQKDYRPAVFQHRGPCCR